MKDLNLFLSRLAWDTPPEQLLEAKEQLKKLSDRVFKYLVQPGGKMHWDHAAELIVEIGYPRVAPILSDLLEWLKDLNWPGARLISDLLVSIKEPLTPFVKDALQSGDQIWNYWIINQVLKRWPIEVVTLLSEPLIALAFDFDEEEAHLAALQLLVNLKLMPTEIALGLIDMKIEDFRNEDIMKDLLALRANVAGWTT
ncbi:DUF5071 domain-containing protein [Cohnella hashimotonis]|uniref:DUF5071 domain-containing protein n=1 Tax=Cohnella hashimotonis TaxID=2826895 RepID=A0ABT6TEG2_9BACL|nr:DUF5071 domain-containing protein [Cohnella hashimotonis]MDI4645228.1 DUF5071 domain-containing protein [Cohnella hashimotonis]